MAVAAKLFAIVLLTATLATPVLAFEVLQNPNLTPGWADADPACGHAKPRSSLSHALRDKILTRYGLPPGTHPDYEIDHLIPRCLGGSDDPSNLWPQPRRSIEPTWNAEAKDRLEHLVCEWSATNSSILLPCRKLSPRTGSPPITNTTNPIDGPADCDEARRVAVKNGGVSLASKIGLPLA